MSGSTRNSSLCKCGISSTVTSANDIQLAQSPYPTAKGLSTFVTRCLTEAASQKSVFTVLTTFWGLLSCQPFPPCFPSQDPRLLSKAEQAIMGGKGSLNSRVDGRVLRGLSIILGNSNKHQMLQFPYGSDFSQKCQLMRQSSLILLSEIVILPLPNLQQPTPIHEQSRGVLHPLRVWLTEGSGGYGCFLAIKNI